MTQKANFKHLKRGVSCKLCGNISGRKKPGSNRRSAGCSESSSNPQLFYCWRKRTIFFLDLQGRIVVAPKWLETHCLLCSRKCIRLIENPKQYWCKTLLTTYFLCYDGTVVCRSLGIHRHHNKKTFD